MTAPSLAADQRQYEMQTATAENASRAPALFQVGIDSKIFGDLWPRRDASGRSTLLNRWREEQVPRSPQGLSHPLEG
jgi:hypothetical protein